MRGVSPGLSHHTPCSRMKPLKRYRMNGKAAKIHLIDLDSEQSDNVIIVDVTDSCIKKWQGSSARRKGKKHSVQTVICIDDDDSPGDRTSGMDARRDDFPDGPSTSRWFMDSTSHFEDVDVEELQFGQENVTPVRLSKCKRTYSGKTSTGNNYRLNDDSDSDFSDCELLEDVTGKVQEQWEKAFSRKKKVVKSGESIKGYQNNTSRPNIDNSHHFSAKKGQNFQNVAAFCSYTNKVGNKAAGSSPCCAKENAHCFNDYLSSDHSDSGDEFLPSIVAFREEIGCSSSHNGNRWSDSASSKYSHHEESNKDYGSNNNREEVEDDHLINENGYVMNDRELIKETDEYKRAMKEEWASRQEALKIQAAEAQNLRQLLKRKKAESIRLLDMERRQKERVEEIRSTQKKDEENMNMKEALCAEVRKELQQLELTCYNMASLLHSLGIHVEGWPNPSPQEVQAAYRRALLSFHPDRVSRNNLRLQVEAEEKFKLMHRMKEKFRYL